LCLRFRPHQAKLEGTRGAVIRHEKATAEQAETKGDPFNPFQPFSFFFSLIFSIFPQIEVLDPCLDFFWVLSCKALTERLATCNIVCLLPQTQFATLFLSGMA
jgi:hypothetical protein